MINEEELQERVESGEVDSGKDARAYELVFQALERRQSPVFSKGFVDNVVTRIEARQRIKLFLEEYLMLAFAVVLIIGGGTYCVVTTKFHFDFGFLSNLSAYAGVLSFGFVLIVLLNGIERRLISKKRRETRL
jgi:hypothetical protein